MSVWCPPCRLFGVSALLFVAVSGVTGFASQIREGEDALISGWQVLSVSQTGASCTLCSGCPALEITLIDNGLPTNYPESFWPWAPPARISIQNWPTLRCTLNETANYLNYTDVVRFRHIHQKRDNMSLQWNICYLVPPKSTVGQMRGKLTFY